MAISPACPGRQWHRVATSSSRRNYAITIVRLRRDSGKTPPQRDGKGVMSGMRDVHSVTARRGVGRHVNTDSVRRASLRGLLCPIPEGDDMALHYFLPENSTTNAPRTGTPARPAARRAGAAALIVNLVAAAAIVTAGLATATIARAQETAPAAETPKPLPVRFVRPNDMGSGALLLPSKRPDFYVEAPRLTTDVEIVVTGPIARTKVTQRFENPTDGWVEGIYVFPLPEDSAVDTLKMKVGDRIIEGVIRTRDEARQVYEQAKQEGKKAALLEQQRDNIFTNEVANIGPNEAIVVQIEYQQTVKQDNGTFSLRFPMVVAPRYSPEPVVQQVDLGRNGWGSTDPVPDRDKIEAPVLDPAENAKINPVSISIKLAAGFPLGEVTSHFHKVVTKEQDAQTRIIALENTEVPADRDFELSWKAAGTAPNAALFAETIGGRDYILAFVTPPQLSPDKLVKKNREAIFIIDNSGSMAGESMDQAKGALIEALKRLDPADTFNVVRFDDTYSVLFDRAVPADREHVDRALAFVGALEAQGGTEMLPALQAAFIDPNANDTSRLRQVIFITDGAIGNEQQLFDAIARGKGRSRVFTIGIGSAPNSFFMSRAAEVGRGTATHIGALGEVQKKMVDFLAKLEKPVMTGLSASLAGGTFDDVSPDPLPDLYMGEPVVLTAALPKATGMLTIDGEFAGQPWSVSMDLAQAAKGEGIGKLWARRKIGSLEASRSYDANPETVDKAIEQTALDHHLVSRLTSLVAVDVTKSRPDGEKLDTSKLPLNLPQGWEYDKVFGEAAPAAPAIRSRSLTRQAFMKTAEMVAAAPAPDASQLAASRTRTIAQPVVLPQTATSAELAVLIGFALLTIGAILFALDRQRRRRAAR